MGLVEWGKKDLGVGGGGVYGKSTEIETERMGGIYKMWHYISEGIN